MRRVGLLLALSLLFAAGSGVARGEPSPILGAAVAEGPTVRALITDTGVVVAVRAATRAGYIVTTPCGNLGYATGGVPVIEARVVLDPGHGGPIDTGAVGGNGLAEKEVNLRVAQVAQRFLERRGISTLLTRTADYATPLFVRAGLADSVGAEILVSIHHNAPTPQKSSLPGTEVFVQTANDDSRRLGGLIHEYTVAGLSIFNQVQWHAAEDAGVLRVLSTRGHDAYGMVRLPETVSALAELAYISSRDEADLLRSGFYADIAGRSLADAIEAYLSSDQPGSGFISEPRIFNPRHSVPASLCQETPLQTR